MPSQIDPTVFPDNQLVDKADLRAQFQIAHDEISAIMGGAPVLSSPVRASLIRAMMLDDDMWDSL